MRQHAISFDGNTLLAIQLARLRSVDVRPFLVRLEALDVPQNPAPAIEAPASIVATEEITVSTPVYASTTPPSPLTFYLESSNEQFPLRLLANAELRDTGNGSANIILTPGYYESGAYPLRLAVFDETGAVTVADIDLTVSDTLLGGDADCNGTVSPIDSGPLISAIFDPESACPLADTNEDQSIKIDDLISVLLKL